MIALISTFEGVTEAGAKLFHGGGEFIKKNYPEVRTQWWTPISGKFGTHFIIWWHASLAAKEVFDGKFLYLVPNQHSIVSRFDAQALRAMPNLPAFHGSFF